MRLVSKVNSSDAKRITSLLIPHEDVSVPKRNSTCVEGFLVFKKEGAGHSQCKSNDWRASFWPAHLLMLLICTQI